MYWQFPIRPLAHSQFVRFYYWFYPTYSVYSFSFQIIAIKRAECYFEKNLLVVVWIMGIRAYQKSRLQNKLIPIGQAV